MAMTPERNGAKRYHEAARLVCFSDSGAYRYSGMTLTHYPRLADAWYRLMTEEGVPCEHDEFSCSKTRAR